MHNPFPLYTSLLLTALIKAGHKYFVRQTYKRGAGHFEQKPTHAFLITQYNDKSKAVIHYEALKNDGNRYLYDISEHSHLQKLQIAAQQPEGYQIYTPLLLKEWEPTKQILGKIKTYVRNLDWKLSRMDELNVNLFTQFGEVFITLKTGKDEIKIPLSDIEKL